MKLIVISPEAADPREKDIVHALFTAGMERYRLRKPGWSAEQLENWLEEFTPSERFRIVLHSHHELAPKLGLAGVHWRDDAQPPARPPRDYGLTSRSCHDLNVLREALGVYDAAIVSPLFPSISKPGYGVKPSIDLAELQRILADRTPAQRHTQVIGLGGIHGAVTTRCVELGLDGIAVRGAIWNDKDPVDAFRHIAASLATVAPFA
ncbi:hypothetical protein DB347_08320 [Opitutaceae bacterium EW11]|nr:hypothetical protein DB347_08320 [Opitutaceae bacterium EW11]